ncbi:MAG: histidine kinase [Marinicella sp.]|nr:histidine kinase [Xanthomonadales bacterium]
MNWLKAPKTTKLFWLFHFCGWGVFVLINFIARQSVHAESMEQGLVSILALLVVNTVLCLMVRELMHRFNLVNLNNRHVWIKLLILVVCFGFVSALLTTLSLSAYFYLFGYTRYLIFFIQTVYQNWLIMTLLIGIWSVIYAVTHHKESINQLKAKQQSTEIQLKEAQLNHLIGQLNPHFLFNGLNNIRGLMLEDVGKARQMLTELSELLRYSLNAPKHALTPLAEEIKVVHNYIELAQIQYESRLNYQESIDQNTLSCMVPPMTLQLLIENAIKHGVDQNQHPSDLILRIFKDQTHLHMQVSNPGQIQTDFKQQQTGIGLNNIKKRLQLIFGQQASLNIENNSEKVTVNIVLPIISHPEQELVS